MGLKKKLGMGIATAALGIGLIGGGTYAYFSDTAEAEATFAAGTLELDANPTTIIDVNNLKPGDWMPRTFKLENNGSLDISKVFLNTDYTVTGATGNDDFGKHINVDFLINVDKGRDVILSKTLYELKSMSPDAVKGWLLPLFTEKSGLKAGTNDDLLVEFRFVDNGQDQNEFQGAKLELEWTFNAEQTKGQLR